MAFSGWCYRVLWGVIVFYFFFKIAANSGLFFFPFWVILTLAMFGPLVRLPAL